MEQLHHEWTFTANLGQRVVASGLWEYLVDLARMTQTNVKHPAHKQRHIRRWTAALGADQTAPGELDPVAADEEDESTGGVTEYMPSGCQLSVLSMDPICLVYDQRYCCAVVAPATPSPKKSPKRKRGGAAATTPAASPSTPSSKAAPAPAAKAVHYSVDPVCNLTGSKVHGDFSCMLNQTNIAAGANNNKYYRIQLLTGRS